MDADGTDVVRLTATPGATEGEPAWSPDGTEIAYTTEGACKRIAKDTFVATAGKQARTLKAVGLKRGRYRVRASTHSDGRAAAFRVK